MEKIPTKAQIIVLVLLGIFIFWGGLKYQEIRLSNVGLEIVGTVEPKEELAVEESTQEIVVHVVGAVENPGIYTFNEGARVAEAIEQALPLAQADLGQLNLALLLEDGKQIEVPEQGEVNQKTGGFAQAVPSEKIGGKKEVSGLVNLNRAGLAELMTLPQVGPAIAGRIVEYREREGPFQKIEDLMQVSGIGTKTFAKLKEQITVE